MTCDLIPIYPGDADLNCCDPNNVNIFMPSPYQAVTCNEANSTLYNGRSRLWSDLQCSVVKARVEQNAFTNGCVCRGATLSLIPPRLTMKASTTSKPKTHAPLMVTIGPMTSPAKQAPIASRPTESLTTQTSIILRSTVFSSTQSPVTRKPTILSAIQASITLSQTTRRPTVSSATQAPIALRPTASSTTKASTTFRRTVSAQAQEVPRPCNDRPTVDDICTFTDICFFTNTSCWTEGNGATVRLPNASMVLCYEAYDEFFRVETFSWSDNDCYLVLLGLRRFCTCSIDNPTELPTVPPALPGAQFGNGTFCFSGSSLVTVENRGDIAMSELRIGDSILTSNHKYEPVYSFGHRKEDIKAEFLKIFTMTTTLEISAEHMILTKTHGFIPALSLRKGDYLLDNLGQEVAIYSIKSATAKGIYAPFTPSGQLVVNGFVVSCFIAFKNSQSLRTFGDLSISYQWIAHMFEFPHRLICYYISMCSDEMYTNAGISKWVAHPLSFAQWLLEQPDSWLKKTTFLMFFIILFFFNVFEFIVIHINFILIFLILLGLVLHRHYFSRTMQKFISK